MHLNKIQEKKNHDNKVEVSYESSYHTKHIVSFQ